tara:strand:- start:289 stop:483 length:195 start_codon:yes stop_codon:yes gene_type:complete
MVEEDLSRWLEFTNRERQHELNREEIKLVAELHSKYYHPNKYHEPCTCNGSIYRRWIQDLNKLV